MLYIRCYNKLYELMRENMINYGQALLSLRAKINITQEELARILNVTFATINRWENNRAVPTKIHIMQIEELCKKHKVTI